MNLSYYFTIKFISIRFAVSSTFSHINNYYISNHILPYLRNKKKRRSKEEDNNCNETEKEKQKKNENERRKNNNNNKLEIFYA